MGNCSKVNNAYDKRVAGVVSGAGDYKPGIVLDKQPSTHIRQPIALLGKVYCKTDASYGADQDRRSADDFANARARYESG